MMKFEKVNYEDDKNANPEVLIYRSKISNGYLYIIKTISVPSQISSVFIRDYEKDSPKLSCLLENFNPNDITTKVSNDCNNDDNLSIFYSDFY